MLNNVRLGWSRGISIKLMVLVTAVTVGVIGITTAFVVEREGRYLMEEVMRGAALFSDAIQSSIYHFMLEDRRGEAYRIMDTVGQQKGVEAVRIFNQAGTVTFSTQGREIGTAVDKRAESCYACHAAGQPIVRLGTRSRSRIYSLNGHRVLGMVTPIYNEPSCSTASCHAHPASQSVLGVLDVSMSLAEIDRSVALLQRATIVLSGLAVVALAFVVNLVVRRLVVRPVTEMVDVTHKIAAGDFTHTVHVDSTGELGILAQSFNTMTESLRAAQDNLRNLMENLEQQVEDRTAALREAQQQLIHSEKMASLGKLAASIAHEINNPLAGILTTAKLLIRDMKEGPPDEATQASFRTLLPLVERETLRCTVIVRNLLDFSRQRDLELAADGSQRGAGRGLVIVEPSHQPAEHHGRERSGELASGRGRFRPASPGVSERFDERLRSHGQWWDTKGGLAGAGRSNGGNRVRRYRRRHTQRAPCQACGAFLYYQREGYRTGTFGRLRSRRAAPWQAAVPQRNQ